jgi:hypothetical protein
LQRGDDGANEAECRSGASAIASTIVEQLIGGDLAGPAANLALLRDDGQMARIHLGD